MGEGEDNLLLREEALHAVISHTNHLCVTGQQLIGQTGIGVLFLQQRLVSHLGGSLEGGLAGEPSDSNHNIRLEIKQYLLHHPTAFQHTERQLQVLHNIGRRQFALQTRDGQPFDFIPCRRHLLHLHASLGTHEEYLGIAPTLLDSIGYCHRRKYVTT